MRPHQTNVWGNIVCQTFVKHFYQYNKRSFINKFFAKCLPTVVTMSNLEEIACCISAAAFIIRKKTSKKKIKNKKRWWVRQFFQRRKIYSGENFILDLYDGDLLNNFTRMSSSDFEFLINLIGPQVAKQNTNYRESISVSVRLAITLRFLSTGDSYHSLMYTFKISKQSISQIVPEVCEALVTGLHTYIMVIYYI